MSALVIRRLPRTLLVLVGVTFVSFGMLFLTGDPAYLMANENSSQEQLQAFRHQMGFDRPWPVQYFDFMSRAVRGDFGTSLRQGQPAFRLVVERMPATLELAVAAMAIAIAIAVPVGLISATFRNSLYDRVSMLLALVGQSVPVFWLGIMLILVFAVQLRWLPVSGTGDLRHLVLPAVALSTYSMARNARMIRSAMLEVLGHEYMRTAYAKGLGSLTIILKHGFRNALIPVITIIGLDFGVLLGGAIVTETIFAWPGVGRLTVLAINGKDFPIVLASVTLLASIFITINLFLDVLYGFLDPRIRHA